MAVKYKASTTRTSSSGQTHGGTSGKFGTPTTTNAMNYNTGPYAAPTTSAMNYNSGPYVAPATTPKPTTNAMNYNSGPFVAPATKATTAPKATTAHSQATPATPFAVPVPTLSSQLGASDNTTAKPNTNPDYGIEYYNANQYPGTPNVVENKTAQPDYMQYLINMVKDQFKYNATSEINALRQAYEQGRGQLQGQIPGVHQNARSAYDANDAYYYTQALPELRAAMEQAGLYKGGDMLGGNVDLLTMRGQNAGQISQDKMNQVNAIQQAIAQLNAEEPLKIAEVEASNNAAEAQALLNAVNMGMQNQLAMGELTGNILGTDTLDKIWKSYEMQMGIADRTGNMPDGSKTLSAQQQEADLAYRQQQFEESVRQFNANYGIDLKRLSLDQVQQELDNKYRMGQLSLQQKNQALNEAQLTYQKEQDLRNYNLQTQEIQQKSAQTYSTYVQQAQKLLSDGATSTDVRSWILSLPISDQQIADMLNVLGL